MLYDNAQLLRIYADAYAITGAPLCKSVVEETAGYLIREMLHGEGGFYSTQDADSEGEEGKFFVWTPGEINRILGSEAGEIFCRIYDVTEPGNFEGKNILHPILSVEQASKYFRTDPTAIENLIADARKKLFSEREKRVKPFRDEKIIAAWNGLALSGLAAALGITADPAWIGAARQTVEFIFGTMFRDGFLLHTYKDGRAKLLGYLDDYAFVAVGLLDLYETLFDRTLLQRARQLTDILVQEFWDDAAAGFFYTGKSHEKLVSRSKPIFDASIPSGNAMAAQLLLRLHSITGEGEYRTRAERILRAYYEPMENQPFGFAHMLCALDQFLRPPKEIVVVGAADDPKTQALVREAQRVYLPNKILQRTGDGEVSEEIPPLLRGKHQVNGQPTAYVCANFTCSAPVTSPVELRALLES